MRIALPADLQNSGTPLSIFSADFSASPKFAFAAKKNDGRREKEIEGEPPASVLCRRGRLLRRRSSIDQRFSVRFVCLQKNNKICVN